MPLALYALTVGAFGIGVTEFVIMGLLLELGADFGVSVPMAGLLISGYAIGVVIGAPLLTALSARWPRKGVLMGLMVIFILGNALGAWAGGAVIDQGAGLGAVPFVAALMPLAAVLIALWSLRLDRKGGADHHDECKGMEVCVQPTVS